jgi:outer membrane protein OmpA-like peptidoglycan-associated protein
MAAGKIILIVGGGLGLLWLMSRSASAETRPNVPLAEDPTVPQETPAPGGIAAWTTPAANPAPSIPPNFSVMFDAGSPRLSRTQIRTLEEQANLYKSRIQTGRAVILHGYSSPEGSEEANYLLSRERISAVARVLVDVVHDPAFTVDRQAHGETGLGQRRVDGWWVSR